MRDFFKSRSFKVLAGVVLVLLGVVLVLLIAASVSTLASITITGSSTLTMDWVQARLRPGMSGAATARLTKAVCAVFIVLSYIIANTDTPILDMMSYSWGILSGSFLAPYLLALYWKGINRAGAWDDRRLCRRRPAGDLQAPVSWCCPALLRQAGGLRPSFRLPGHGGLLPPLFPGQRPCPAGRLEIRGRQPRFL
mgnify:CR=1 FL=1